MLTGGHQGLHPPPELCFLKWQSRQLRSATWPLFENVQKPHFFHPPRRTSMFKVTALGIEGIGNQILESSELNFEYNIGNKTKIAMVTYMRTLLKVFWEYPWKSQSHSSQSEEIKGHQIFKSSKKSPSFCGMGHGGRQQNSTLG